MFYHKPTICRASCNIFFLKKKKHYRDVWMGLLISWILYCVSHWAMPHLPLSPTQIYFIFWLPKKISTNNGLFFLNFCRYSFLVGGWYLGQTPSHWFSPYYWLLHRSLSSVFLLDVTFAMPFHRMMLDVLLLW